MSTAGLEAAYLQAKARHPGLTVSLGRVAETIDALGVDAARIDAHGIELVLAHAAAGSDPAAVEAIETEALIPARRVIRRYTRDEARTDEVMQQLRIHLMVAEPPATPRLARFDGRASLGAWINMCATRLALHALRDQRTRREIATEWSEALADLPAADPVVEALRLHHAARVAEALSDACMALSGRHRAILRLLFVQGASIDEAAAMYHVHRVSVWRWVQEARAELAAGTRARLSGSGSHADASTASLVAWVEDQVELSLDEVLAPTATAPRRAGP